MILEHVKLRRFYVGIKNMGIFLLATALVMTLILNSGFTSPMVRPVRAAFPGANGKIAFVSDRDGNFEVYAMNSDGSSVTRLTNNPATEGEPAWSPDGTKIAFESGRDGNVEIYVMNPDGSGQTRLTNNPADDEDLDWQPTDLSPPSISNVVYSPQVPQLSDTVTVTAIVTDIGFGLKKATLRYSTDGGATWTSISMNVSTGSTYKATIPAKPDGTTVTFKVKAEDYIGNTAESTTYTYQVKGTPAAGIPGFPIESILLGIAISVAMLTTLKSRKTDPKIRV